MTIQSEIEKVYKSCRGGFFVDINQYGVNPSPTRFLENEYWSGVCISDNSYYLKDRKCYTCNYGVTDNLYEKDGFCNYWIHSKIFREDKSTLYHFMYINVDNCIDVATSLLKSMYERAYEIETNVGFWPNQILFLSIVINETIPKIEEFKKLCELYFLEYQYTIGGNIFIFKNKILSNI
jgi:hypothetical protein